MSRTLVVHGHGKWHLKDGYVQSPRGVTIDFYTEGGKNQLTGFAYLYFIGAWNEKNGVSEPLTGGGVDLSVGPYRQAPNYTLSALSGKQYASAQKYIDRGTLKDDPNFKILCMKPGARSIRLATILQYAAKKNFSKVVYMACRAVDLKKVGGRALGFNAPQADRHVSRQVLDEHLLTAELQALELEGIDAY